LFAGQLVPVEPAPVADDAPDTPDAVLAAAFLAGSQPAFDALYSRYASPIHDFLR
jgi:hypothetical protein